MDRGMDVERGWLEALADRGRMERRVIEAWDRMLDICPRCEHCLDQYDAYETMGEAVQELRGLHFPDDAYGETKARHDVEEDIRISFRRQTNRED